LLNKARVLTNFFACRHSTALWDLQDDFYLHNYHVKTGKGASHTMKTYQIAFGIDCHDGTDVDNERIRLSDRAAILAESSNLPPLPLHGRTVSRESTRSSEGGESRRIANVRKRCVSQNQGMTLARLTVPAFSDSCSFLIHFPSSFPMVESCHSGLYSIPNVDAAWYSSRFHVTAALRAVVPSRANCTV
jgi:hypothetical protein